MPSLSPDELPLPQRLALSYAPRKTRDAWLAFLLFDARLAGFVAQANEPVLAQMRLAWWRDALRKRVAEYPRGEPLLAALGESFPGKQAAPIALVDGWERLLADPPLGEDAVEEFVSGRAAVMRAIAELCSSEERTVPIESAARSWTLADLAIHTADPGERKALFDSLAEEAGDRQTLPRAMRPLAVLAALGRRAAARGEGPLLGDRRSVLLAMRVGLFGR